MDKSRRRRGAKLADSHVRLYGWELETPAYRTLSTDARALLVEFRALYAGKANRVFMSVREMQRRLGNVGQRRAQSARDELLERGWIMVIEPGGFSRKTRHATVYALTNEPLEERDGATATKNYMRWWPKNTPVVEPATVNSYGSYRYGPPSPICAWHDSRIGYRGIENLSGSVAMPDTQIDYQGGWLWSLFSVALNGEEQLRLIFWALLASTRAEALS